MKAFKLIFIWIPSKTYIISQFLTFEKRNNWLLLELSNERRSNKKLWCVIIKPGKLSPFIKKMGSFQVKRLNWGKKRPSFFYSWVCRCYWRHKKIFLTSQSHAYNDDVFCLIELMFLVNKCKLWLHEPKKTPYLVRVSYLQCPVRYIRRLSTQR